MAHTQKNLMTQSQYARHRGLSRQYINNLIRQNILDLTDGKIDQVAADEALLARHQPLKQITSRMNTGAFAFEPDSEEAQLTETLLKIRLKKEMLQAKLLETQRHVETGRYILAEEYEKYIFNFFRPIRDMILSVPDRLDAQIAAMDDKDEISNLVRQELLRAMEPAEKFRKHI